MIYDVDLQRLDVVRTSWVYAPDGLAYRFELRDGRRLDRTVSYDVLDRGGSDAVWSWIRRELERAYRRCVEHDDCAELRALGEACWASTQNKSEGKR